MNPDGSFPEWFKPAVMIAGLALFWTWETVRPFFERPQGRWRHGGRNLFVALVNSLLIALAFGAATVSVTAWAEASRFGVLHQTSLPTWGRWLLAIVLLDGWLYVWHRLNHTIQWLWRFHRMHHADRDMDVTTAVRFHIGELSMSAIARLALISALGVTSPQIVLNETLVVAATMFHHANISIGRFDRWLALGFITPFLHKVHHSREPIETNSNYSVVFSLWDRLGGTLRQRDECRSLTLGLNEFDDPQWETVAGLMTIPMAQAPSRR